MPKLLGHDLLHQSVVVAQDPQLPLRHVKLVEQLPEAFSDLEGSDPTAEDLVGVLDKLCDIAWINEEGDDEIARGFMDGSDGYEDDEY